MSLKLSWTTMLLVILMIHCTSMYMTTSAQAALDDAVQPQDSVRPYLLYAAGNTLNKAYLDGEPEITLLFRERYDRVKSISYHYRRNKMFWSTVNNGRVQSSIRSADLDGSNVQTVELRAGNVVDIQVDWINDKLYWLDSLNHVIKEHDLATGENRVVLRTNCNSEGVCDDSQVSSPKKLTIYPYNHSAILWWSDSDKLSIMTTAESVTASQIKTFIALPGSCGRTVDSLSVSVHSNSFFYTYYCRQAIIATNLQGDDESVREVVISSDLFVQSDIVEFNNSIYFISTDRIFKSVGSSDEQILRHRGTLINKISIVHPSMQPLDLKLSDLCPNSCSGNGVCLESRKCACNEGWEGKDCSTGINVIPTEEPTTIPPTEPPTTEELTTEAATTTLMEPTTMTTIPEPDTTSFVEVPIDEITASSSVVETSSESVVSSTSVTTPMVTTSSIVVQTTSGLDGFKEDDPVLDLKLIAIIVGVTVTSIILFLIACTCCIIYHRYSKTKGSWSPPHNFNEHQISVKNARFVNTDYHVGGTPRSPITLISLQNDGNKAPKLPRNNRVINASRTNGSMKDGSADTASFEMEWTGSLITPGSVSSSGSGTGSGVDVRLEEIGHYTDYRLVPVVEHHEDRHDNTNHQTI